MNGKKKKTVLIVDDHRMILKLVSEIIEDAGYAAVIVSSGREALQALQDNEPDVMLLDIVMPDMNGFDVLRELKRSSRCAVIACSFDSANSKRALSLGAKAFLTKPYDHQELLDAIAELIGRADTP